jgi:hypothetical protein
MNKLEWLHELNNLVTSAREKSWESAQDKMIDDFESSEKERLELFNENENVGYIEELIQLAQSYQGSWRYENNSSMDFIF